MVLEKVDDLRYGENPHQRAAFYRETTHRSGTLADATQLRGERPSGLSRPRSRARRHDKMRVLGRYHPKSESQLPYIELRMDKILSRLNRKILLIPPWQDLCIGLVPPGRISVLALPLSRSWPSHSAYHSA